MAELEDLEEAEEKAERAVDEMAAAPPRAPAVPIVLAARLPLEMLQSHAPGCAADPASMALDAPRQAVLQILDELNIPACDLTEPLRQAADPYFVYDGHWTTEGHTVVAETLSRCLSSR